MSEDSRWFRTEQQLKGGGYVRAGADWIRPVGELVLMEGPQTGYSGFDDRTAAPPQRYMPLYEAKMVHHFDHRWATYKDLDSRDSTTEEKQSPDFEATPRYWVPAEEVQKRFAAQGWTREWLMGWRDICRATDERSVIASVLPRTAIGNKVPLMFQDSSATVPMTCALVANLSSLVLDYCARQKIGGTTLNLYLLFQFPVLPPDAYCDSVAKFLTERAVELIYTSHLMAPFARDSGYNGPPFAWDEQRRAQLRAELDASFARAYGLSRDELRYILDPADVMGPDYPSETFRVLKNNEMRKFGEYQTQRLVHAAWDRMEAGDLPAPTPYNRCRVQSGSTHPAGVRDGGTQGALAFAEARSQ
jgi:hypothetical protein